MTTANAIKHAAFNWWQAFAIFSVMLNAFIIFNPGISQFLTGEAPPPPPRQLGVVSLGFENGMIAQWVEPALSDEPIQARWSASISTANGFVVCGGVGGFASYDKKTQPKLMTPSDWVGDDCMMTEGEAYKAKAQWSWLNPDGSVGSTQHAFNFIYKAPVELVDDDTSGKEKLSGN